MNKISIISRLSKLAQMLDSMDMPQQADGVTDVMQNLADSPQVTAWANFGRSLARKDPDFMPPVKPKASMITYSDITEKAIADYHLYKNNKRQLPKLTSMEENQLKTLAQNADRAR